MRAYFEDGTPPQQIQQAFAGFATTINKSVSPVAVQEAADREPIRVGSHFLVVPADLIVLPIDAAMAFGSGRHETTQLCLEALEQYVRPGQTVFDVGCGSGILALAAQKLGAASVIGADIDEAAVGVARRHFPGPLFVGSADGFPSSAADLVLCNITASVNDRIATDLQRIAKPTGRVVISGFTAPNVPTRFQPERILRLGDWQCWICNPGRIADSGAGDDPNIHNERWW